MALINRSGVAGWNGPEDAVPWLAPCGGAGPGAAGVPLVFDTASLQKVRPGRSTKMRTNPQAYPWNPGTPCELLNTQGKLAGGGY